MHALSTTWNGDKCTNQCHAVPGALHVYHALVGVVDIIVCVSLYCVCEIGLRYARFQISA